MALASNALTTLSLVKSVLSIGDSSKDTLLEHYINASSARIEAFCNRRFKRTAVTDEAHQGFGFPELYVERAPIDTSETISITLNGDSLGASNYEVADADEGLIYHKSGWPWTARSIAGSTYEPMPGTERYSLKVSYTGGYYLPDSGSRDLPYDIEDACVALVVDRYSRPNKAIKSESLMEWSAAYSDTDIMNVVGPALSKYRRLVA